MKKVVLLVEDDADFRRLVTLWLEGLGFGVVEAADGLEGLRLLRQHTPCVILLDLMMPVLDGRGFRAQQKADATFASIPVICLSAAHNARLIADEIDATVCLTKPVDWDSLVAHVERFCS